MKCQNGFHTGIWFSTNHTYAGKKRVQNDRSILQYSDAEGRVLLEPHKHVYVTVTCPTASVNRITTAYDINMIDEKHEIIYNTPATRLLSSLIVNLTEFSLHSVESEV